MKSALDDSDEDNAISIDPPEVYNLDEWGMSQEKNKKKRKDGFDTRKGDETFDGFGKKSKRR